MIFKRVYVFLLAITNANIHAEISNYSKLTVLPLDSGVHFVMNNYKTASSFGAVGNGISDDTDALIKAFSSGANLDLEGKKYFIDLRRSGSEYGLIPSNNTMIEGNGAEIILKPNNLTHYSMITLAFSENVKIHNLKLTGDVRRHNAASGGEWGMGFSILGSKNCELYNVEANEMWGDGFYVGAYGEETNEGGGIFNSSARANLRVGISVARCKNFSIVNCKFTDTGTINAVPPGFGVDIEPNPYFYDSIDGIKLINIVTENNLGGGILFVPRNLEFSTNPHAKFNVYIENFVSKSDGFKKYWLSSGLRFVEYLSENTYNGLVEIKGFDVIQPKEGVVPFRWERNDDSSLTVQATDLKVDGVSEYDYLY